MSEDREVKNRVPITIAIMLATLMNTLDSTIANVALPHIQGSLSASADQIGWVLTSYIVAAAMVTPVSGWLANRLGVKTVFLVAIGGFTAASMLCGVAANLPQLVVFRLLQGGFGAFTIPLSQAVLLNINPPENQAKAMSLWAMGTILGPILGPVIGGYITDEFSWRWCFYINLPVGALACLGVWAFMPSEPSATTRRFDFLGFGSLIVAVAALQLMLDRGPSQDWFSSPEIWTEALTAGISAWVFFTHTITTAHPFIDLALTRDRNLVGTCAFGFLAQSVMFGSLAILPILMQSLMGYPVLTSGLVSTPRGLGMMLAIWAAPRLGARIDLRLLLAVGLVGNAVALWQMMHFDLSMTARPLVLSGFVQGMAQGLLFVPMTTLAFATVPAALRTEASAMFNLLRGLGGSIGISVMQALAAKNSQVMHASLAAQVTPSDPVFRWALDRAFSPDTLAGALALDAQLNRQAAMVAYVDDFRVMFVVSLLCAPLVLLLRAAKRAPI
ncbi:MAG: drug resistance transporter, EmrB/QacA subfamily, partial [Phenylobacterium sp.]|nr:drug resistance transporter, EmrB/QacA subfamily [Phenylobacterium sp.]